MEKDRRSAPRVRVKLQARWEGVLSRESATVTDLSRSGCFVLTGGKVEVKELVWLGDSAHRCSRQSTSGPKLLTKLRRLVLR